MTISSAVVSQATLYWILRITVFQMANALLKIFTWLNSWFMSQNSISWQILPKCTTWPFPEQYSVYLQVMKVMKLRIRSWFSQVNLVILSYFFNDTLSRFPQMYRKLYLYILKHVWYCKLLMLPQNVLRKYNYQLTHILRVRM